MLSRDDSPVIYYVESTKAETAALVLFYNLDLITLTLTTKARSQNITQSIYLNILDIVIDSHQAIQSQLILKYPLVVTCF